MREKLKNAFFEQKIALNDEQIDKFLAYYHFLVQENEKFNLTAITDFDEVIVKHFVDSALFAKNIKLGAKVIDVGSGAGFPGIPVKIIRPDLDVVLLDSLNKRVNFLNATIKLLNLEDICAVHARVEDYAKENREKFDATLSRAVAKINTLSEYLLPLVKVGGHAVMGKSQNFKEELVQGERAIRILGGKLEKIDNFRLKDVKNDEIYYERTLIYIKKVTKTPNLYPRQGNKPKTQPL